MGRGDEIAVNDDAVPARAFDDAWSDVGRGDEIAVNDEVACDETICGDGIFGEVRC